MPIFKPKEQPVPQCSVCWTGYAISERIMFHPKPGEGALELGWKRFHCIRRYTSYALESCNGCLKDITQNSIYIHKPLYSERLAAILYECYKIKAKERPSSGDIWWDDKYAMEIKECIWPEKKIEEVPF